MLSPVLPGMLQYAACLHPRQCSAGCCVGAVLCTPYSLPWQGNAGIERCSALLWGSEKPQGGREAALRVTAWQNCLLSESTAKTSPPALQLLIILYIACVRQVTTEDIDPCCPSSPSLTLAALIFLTDLTRGLGRSPCTCTWLCSPSPEKRL